MFVLYSRVMLLEIELGRSSVIASCTEEPFAINVGMSVRLVNSRLYRNSLHHFEPISGSFYVGFRVQMLVEVSLTRSTVVAYITTKPLSRSVAFPS